MLLADTTGELPGFIKSADLVLMGKTMAGNNEGQNIIEPAVMGKPVICGPELRNFREALNLLVRAEGVCRLENDEALTEAMSALLADPEGCRAMGSRASAAMAENRGAVQRTIESLENLLNSTNTPS